MDRSCDVCRTKEGNMIQCTGPCLRTFHIPLSKSDAFDPFVFRSFFADSQKCDVLKVCPDMVEKLIKTKEAFLCPLCWKRESLCSRCKSKGSELTKCSVSGCSNQFCSKCRNDPEMAMSSGSDFFICSHHFCCHCKSLEGQSEDNPLIPCLLCPKAMHLRCFPPRIHPSTNACIYVRSEPHETPLLAKDVLVCLEHKQSLEEVWKNVLSTWKDEWLQKMASEIVRCPFFRFLEHEFRRSHLGWRRAS